MTVPALSSGRAARGVLALVILLVVASTAFGPAGIALAHTAFDSSTPADGDVVTAPIDEITVGFTNPAVPAGDGFVLLDASGSSRAPTSVDATDGTRFVLRFDPPLPAGTYGVRWEVRAGDAHPISGSFRFEVAGPAPDDADDAATPSTTPTSPPDDDDATADRDDALAILLADDGGADDGAAVGRVGRTLTFTGTIFGVGALAALVWVVRGRRDELRSVLGWIRLAGLAVATGGIVELASLQAASGVGAGELVDTKAGLAAVLKTIGGLAAWFGFHERAGRLVAPQLSLSSAVATDLRVEGTTHAPADATAHRWMPVGAAVVGLAGYAIVLVSFWLDGHTVSRGPWALHSFVNLVHLAAAAVWGGGVFAMTTVAWMRRRRSEQPGLAEMVVRFSGLATWSLAAVVAAGVAMAALILESPGDLTSTEWGRVLLLKVGAVSVAAGLGAYNHVRLRPALERSPGDPALARELRTTLAVESAVLACVLVLTAWLVAAAV